MAATGLAIMPSTYLERLYQGVDEVEEMSGKRWARRSEVRRGGERAGAQRSSRRQWRSGGSAALALRTSGGVKEEAERVRRAAGRSPFQASQRAAWSGRARRVAATRRRRPDAGRPLPAEIFDSVTQ